MKYILINNLSNALQDGKYQPKEFITCQSLADLFGIDVGQLKSSQQDANEFINYVLNKLSEENLSIKNIFNFKMLKANCAVNGPIWYYGSWLW